MYGYYFLMAIKMKPAWLNPIFITFLQGMFWGGCIVLEDVQNSWWISPLSFSFSNFSYANGRWNRNHSCWILLPQKRWQLLHHTPQRYCRVPHVRKLLVPLWTILCQPILLQGNHQKARYYQDQENKLKFLFLSLCGLFGTIHYYSLCHYLLFPDTHGFAILSNRSCLSVTHTRLSHVLSNIITIRHCHSHSTVTSHNITLQNHKTCS